LVKCCGRVQGSKRLGRYLKVTFQHLEHQLGLFRIKVVLVVVQQFQRSQVGQELGISGNGKVTAVVETWEQGRRAERLVGARLCRL
jgi:hypothetical protein